MLENENVIRLTVFFGVLVTMLTLEAILPQKKRTQKRIQRWPTNIAMIFLGALSLRLCFPVLAVGTALYAQGQGWGLFNFLAFPDWLAFVGAIILLDMLIYWQHVASHHIPFLWVFHRVHHVDRDLDVTTGVRFHPIEILLSMAFKLLCIVVLGAPAAAVILFEVILNGCAMFNHANVRIPKKLDTLLRYILVTPNMHRIHHSVLEVETHSNYGFSISLWDRLFGTYRRMPKDGHNNMRIGLADHQDNQPASLWWCLLFPFSRFLPKVFPRENIHS